MDRQDRIGNALIVAALAVILLVVVSVTAKGDDAAYWDARVKAAIAIHQAEQANPWYPPVPVAKPEVPAPPKAESRPKIQMFTATWCGPCQSAKAAIKAAKFPFDVEYVDVSNGGQPGWCASIPAFAWQANGQTRYVLGFPGADQLTRKWQATQNPAVKATADAYTPGWTWPGDLKRHLLTTHGVHEAAGLTQDQAEQVHDALHNGYSVNQIRKYAISRGLIKQ